MSNYKKTREGNWLIRKSDGAAIPPVSGNRDYEDFLKSGEIPDEADPAPLVVKMISKLAVTDRLIAAGKIEAAIAALNSDPIGKFRWDAAQEIASNDEQVRGFLSAIGANPEEILA